MTRPRLGVPALGSRSSRTGRRTASGRPQPWQCPNGCGADTLALRIVVDLYAHEYGTDDATRRKAQAAARELGGRPAWHDAEAVLAMVGAPPHRCDHQPPAHVQQLMDSLPRFGRSDRLQPEQGH